MARHDLNRTAIPGKLAGERRLRHPVEVVAVQVGEHDEVEGWEVFDLHRRVRQPSRAETVAQVHVVPGVEEVGVGQERETSVANDNGRRPDKEDGASLEAGLLAPDG